MKNTEKYHRPFTLAWFLQRTFTVLKERRTPDMTLFKKELKTFFKRQDKKQTNSYKSYTAIPAELLEPGSYHHAHPLTINRNEKEQPNFINDYFDRIYVTSPHSRSDTRLEMIRRLKHLGIVATIVETDDRELTRNEDLKGLAIILKDARENHFRRILHLKDTVIFTNDFHVKFREAVTNIPDDWKLLFLGSYRNTPTLNLLLSGTFAIGIDSSLFRSMEKSIQTGISNKSSSPLVIPGLSTEMCKILSPPLAIDYSKVNMDGSGLAEFNFSWNLEDFDEGPGPELVSVIMPAFNAGKTIEKSIRSILRQSYRNLELIVADDCSDDNTREIVKELSKMDPRLHLIERKVNQGCYFARNDALRATSGKYIAVQDADDISFEKRIEKQLIPIVAGDALFTLAWIMRSRLKITDLDLEDEPAMIKKVLDNRQLLPDKSYGYWDKPILGFMTSVFHRSLFEELGLFWEYRFGADAEYFERILFRKTGRILNQEESKVHSLLRNIDSIPGIYRRVEQILLISA